MNTERNKQIAARNLAESPVGQALADFLNERAPKSHYNMENATLVDSANHLLWLLGRMANRLHNATSPASIGEQKADALAIMDETQPLIDALNALDVYRPNGIPAPEKARRTLRVEG